MRVRPVSVRVAGALAALTAMAACSSSPGSATISGGGPAVTSSASVAAHSDVSAAVLPTDLKIVVDGDPPGADATAQAILAGNLAYYQALFQAISRGNPDDPLYKKWTGHISIELNAQADAYLYIRAFTSAGQTATGTLRLYGRRITSVKDGTANLTWCEDQSNFFDKNMKTGAVTYTTPSRNSLYFTQGTEQKGADGRWITVWAKGVRGDPRCT